MISGPKSSSVPSRSKRTASTAAGDPSCIGGSGGIGVRGRTGRAGPAGHRRLTPPDPQAIADPPLVPLLRRFVVGHVRHPFRQVTLDHMVARVIVGVAIAAPVA